MRYLLALAFLLWSSLAQAQAAVVQYDYVVAGATVAQVQAWVPVLYVNGTAFNLALPTCTAPTATLITCSTPLPTITSALTPTGTQTFELSLRDPVLGESLKSAPLGRTRPSAPTVLRFSWVVWALPGSTS